MRLDDSSTDRRDSFDNWQTLRNIDEEVIVFREASTSSSRPAMSVRISHTTATGDTMQDINGDDTTPSVARFLSSSPPRMDSFVARPIDDVLDEPPDLREDTNGENQPSHSIAHKSFLQKPSVAPMQAGRSSAISVQLSASC